MLFLTTRVVGGQPALRCHPCLQEAHWNDISPHNITEESKTHAAPSRDSNTTCFRFPFDRKME